MACYKNNTHDISLKIDMACYLDLELTQNDDWQGTFHGIERHSTRYGTSLNPISNPIPNPNTNPNCIELHSNR